ncbi:nicotinic acid mononucleotide adenylyltransferase [Lewinellaceae bacterium SD302]|nr:nicotinic acid mononucleotide adenylyltransferase [Lewinellaceae bacterium SD302]
MSKGKKIGLFFGSFNPVHTGHMVIANYMATQTELDEVWLIVSPQNPFKKSNSLADQYSRLHLVKLAIGDTPKLRASDIEFKLPKPSYTIDTLTFLREEYPDKQFSLIMGGDNLPTLPKWKNYEVILRDYSIYVYQRPGVSDLGELADHPSVHLQEAPLMQLSATYVRRCIKAGKSIRYLVPDAVAEELERSGLYR